MLHNVIQSTTVVDEHAADAAAYILGHRLFYKCDDLYHIIMLRGANCMDRQQGNKYWGGGGSKFVYDRLQYYHRWHVYMQLVHEAQIVIIYNYVKRAKMSAECWLNTTENYVVSVSVSKLA